MDADPRSLRLHGAVSQRFGGAEIIRFPDARFGIRQSRVAADGPGYPLRLGSGAGTIALVMDCDTTGIEPDFALVKFKKLAGGGYFKIINESIPPALERLGYTARQIEDIVRHCRGAGTLTGCPHINRASLQAKGF